MCAETFLAATSRVNPQVKLFLFLPLSPAVSSLREAADRANLQLEGDIILLARSKRYNRSHVSQDVSPAFPSTSMSSDNVCPSFW
jgi:hypothetical protein